MQMLFIDANEHQQFNKTWIGKQTNKVKHTHNYSKMTLATHCVWGFHLDIKRSSLAVEEIQTLSLIKR